MVALMLVMHTNANMQRTLLVPCDPSRTAVLSMATAVCSRAVPFTRPPTPFENDRETFTDSHWRNSCEYTLRLAVSLASCVTPFAEDPYLPLEHAAALSLVVHLTERCRDFDKGGKGAELEGAQGLPTGLHSSLKYCTKKNGLGKSASEVSGAAWPIEERVSYMVGVALWR